MTLVDFDTGMKVLDAITTATPAQKRMLVKLADAAAADENGDTWIGDDTATRGEWATLRALDRRGLVAKNRRGFRLTDAGRHLLDAVRDEAESLENAAADDRAERRRR